MAHPSRRIAVVGSAAAVVGMALSGQAAQAAPVATSAHCPTTTSIALLPLGTGYLFPNLFTSVSACGFTDGGAPYHFTVDKATSSVQTVSGPRTYTLYNVKVRCSAVAVNGDSLSATGCQPG